LGMVVPLATGVSENDDYQRACGRRETPLQGTDSFGSLPAPIVSGVPGTAYLTAWANSGKITDNNERARSAVDVDQAGTPRTAGVERLMPRENGQRLVGGKREEWFDLSAGIARFGA